MSESLSYVVHDILNMRAFGTEPRSVRESIGGGGGERWGAGRATLLRFCTQRTTELVFKPLAKCLLQELKFR